MYNSQETSTRIKKTAKEKGIPMLELQELCGLNKNAIAQAGKSQEGMKAKNLYAIAELLDCSVDYLLGRTDDPNRHSVFTVSGVSISGDNHNGIRAVNTGNLTVSNGPKLNEMEQHLLEAFRALDFSQKIETVSSLMKLAQKKSPTTFRMSIFLKALPPD